MAADRNYPNDPYSKIWVVFRSLWIWIGIDIDALKALMKPDLNKQTLLLKLTVHSFNDLNLQSMYTVQIKLLCFPVSKLRSSLINWTHSQTYVYSLIVELQSRSLTSCSQCWFLVEWLIGAIDFTLLMVSSKMSMAQLDSLRISWSKVSLEKNVDLGLPSEVTI